MSAPSRSASSAISFMKLMRVASMALATYLVSLGAAHVHQQQAVAVAQEGRVQRAHQQHGLLVVGAQHHAVGPHEVLDGRAFLQELGVGDDGEGQHRGAPRSPSATAAMHRSAVPTGTVLLSTMTL
jgi:hypothetical protein